MTSPPPTAVRHRHHRPTEATVLEQQRVIERLQRRIAELDAKPRPAILKAKSGEAPSAAGSPASSDATLCPPSHDATRQVGTRGGALPRLRNPVSGELDPARKLPSTCTQRRGITCSGTLREEARLPIAVIQRYLDTVHQLRLSVGAPSIARPAGPTGGGRMATGGNRRKTTATSGRQPEGGGMKSWARGLLACHDFYAAYTTTTVPYNGWAHLLRAIQTPFNVPWPKPGSTPTARHLPALPRRPVGNIERHIKELFVFVAEPEAPAPSNAARIAMVVSTGYRHREPGFLATPSAVAGTAARPLTGTAGNTSTVVYFTYNQTPFNRVKHRRALRGLP